MNILLINQPINNRGDESAHRSLMRQINKQFPAAEISVFFFNENQDSVDQFAVRSKHNKYFNYRDVIKGAHFSKQFGLRFNLLKLSGFHPSHRKYVNLIKKSDLVICAPGGICMGGWVPKLEPYLLALLGHGI